MTTWQAPVLPSSTAVVAADKDVPSLVLLQLGEFRPHSRTGLALQPVVKDFSENLKS